MNQEGEWQAKSQTEDGEEIYRQHKKAVELVLGHMKLGFVFRDST